MTILAKRNYPAGRKMPRGWKAGERNPGAKVGKSVVAYIRENYQPFKLTTKMLAEKFGLSAGNVRAIVRGRCWPGKTARPATSKLTPEQEAGIIQMFYATRHLRQRHPEKWSHRKLAAAFHVSKGLIVHVLSGKKKSVLAAAGATSLKDSLSTK